MDQGAFSRIDMLAHFEQGQTFLERLTNVFNFDRDKTNGTIKLSTYCYLTSTAPTLSAQRDWRQALHLATSTPSGEAENYT